MRPTPSWPNSCRPLAWGSACHPQPDTLSVQQHCAFNYSPSYKYSSTEMSCWNIKPYIHPYPSTYFPGIGGLYCIVLSQLFENEWIHGQVHGQREERKNLLPARRATWRPVRLEGRLQVSRLPGCHVAGLQVAMLPPGCPNKSKRSPLGGQACLICPRVSTAARIGSGNFSFF